MKNESTQKEEPEEWVWCEKALPRLQRVRLKVAMLLEVKEKEERLGVAQQQQEAEEALEPQRQELLPLKAAVEPVKVEGEEEPLESDVWE